MVGRDGPRSRSPARTRTGPQYHALSAALEDSSIYPSNTAAFQSDLSAAERAVSVRLLPLLVLIVVVSFIDRTNLAFASVTMKRDLGLSNTIYGLGSGLFFLGYASLQVPSNLLLLRLGAPAWLALITFTWGCLAATFAATQGPLTFLLLRLLLGAAESGAMPGIWYYVSQFYPPHRTTLPLAVIETGITASQVLAAPLSAALLTLEGKGGLWGWQWLFLLEGVPAVLLAVAIWFLLPTSIATASFLSPLQRAALQHSFKQAGRAAAGAEVGQGGGGSSSSHHGNEALCQHDAAAAAAVIGQRQSPPVPPLSPAASSRHGQHGARSSSSSRLRVVARAGAEAPWPDNHGHQQQQQQQEASDLERPSPGPHSPLYIEANAGHQSHPAVHEPHCEEGESQLLLAHERDGALDSSTSPLSAAADAAASGASPVSREGCAKGSKGEEQEGLLSAGAHEGGKVSWQVVKAALAHPVVRYAGCWRILHDIPGYGVLYWTPIMVEAVLAAAAAAAAAAEGVAAHSKGPLELREGVAAHQRGLLGGAGGAAGAWVQSLMGTGATTPGSNWGWHLPVAAAGVRPALHVTAVAPPQPSTTMTAAAAGVAGGGAWLPPSLGLAGRILGQQLELTAPASEPGSWVQPQGVRWVHLPLWWSSSSLSLKGATGASGADLAAPKGAPTPSSGRAGAAGHSPVTVVLLSSIPYACASMFHVGNAWHAQHTQEWRWHIAGVWCVGAAALLLLPLLWGWHAAAAFVALTVAHVGINGANGLQTGLVARCLQGSEKALGLAMYNTIGSLGGVLGPFFIGVMVDAAGGYALAMFVLSGCLAGAAAMVWCFKPTY